VGVGIDAPNAGKKNRCLARIKNKCRFFKQYLNGQALPEDIDDYVDRWHSNPGSQQIYEFLGMSEDEYSLWLRDLDMLPHIARARRERRARFIF
jgi:hypothetical protein